MTGSKGDQNTLAVMLKLINEITVSLLQSLTVAAQEVQIRNDVCLTNSQGPWVIHLTVISPVVILESRSSARELQQRLKIPIWKLDGIQ